MPQLDSDLLRTFLAVAQSGSLTDGAMRIHRTQSAASLQIKRLETTLGAQVFTRHGRGVRLTGLGARLLPVAREVTVLLDDTFRTLTADGLAGRLRIGLPDDHTQTRLARILAQFAQSHPQVELDVTCDLSVHFPDKLRDGRLDLAVYEVETASGEEILLTRDPTAWVQKRGSSLATRSTLPVALFDRACWWRDVALAALKSANRPYRIAYSSQSVNGVAAAIEAGIAIGLLGTGTLPDTLEPVPDSLGLPDMPASHLVLGTGAGASGDAVGTMRRAITDAFAHPA